MKAEIISIGNELLTGRRTDSNGPLLANELSSLGVDVFRISIAADDGDTIAGAVRDALSRADIVITTGGMGATDDDHTREGVAAAIGEEPYVDESLEDRFREAGPPSLKQAWMVPSARTVDNPRGDTPGWWIEHQGKQVICLPGSPTEVERIWERDLRSGLREVLSRPRPAAAAPVLPPPSEPEPDVRTDWGPPPAEDRPAAEQAGLAAAALGGISADDEDFPAYEPPSRRLPHEEAYASPPRAEEGRPAYVPPVPPPPLTPGPPHARLEEEQDEEGWGADEGYDDEDYQEQAQDEGDWEEGPYEEDDLEREYQEATRAAAAATAVPGYRPPNRYVPPEDGEPTARYRPMPRVYRGNPNMRYLWIPGLVTVLGLVIVGIVLLFNSLTDDDDDSDVPALGSTATSTAPAAATTTAAGTPQTTPTTATDTTPTTTAVETPAGTPAPGELAPGQVVTVDTGEGGSCMNIRSSEELADNILTCVDPGTELTIVSQGAFADDVQWYEVDYGDGQGFASGEFLVPVE